MDGWPGKMAGGGVWSWGHDLEDGFALTLMVKAHLFRPKQHIGYNVLLTFVASCWVDYELSGTNTPKALALQPSAIIALELLDGKKSCRLYTENHSFDLAESCESAMIRSSFSCKAN